MFDILNLIVAATGVFIAVWAYRKSRLADEANKRYQEVQKQLAELQLIAAQKANIVLEFQVERVVSYKSSGHKSTAAHSEQMWYLLIRNVGNVEAYNIKLAFESAIPNTISPSDLKRVEPIPILASGTDIRITFALMNDESDKLNGSWSWENPNKTTEIRKSYFIIPL